MRSLLAAAVIALPLAVAAACGTEDGIDADAASTGQADGALDGAAILGFVNSERASFEVLDVDVGLDARAARAIVAHVWGADARFGTADDDHCDTLDELLDISYVGDAAVAKLEAYAHALAPPAAAAVTLEGVAFSATEAAAALSHCNDRSETQLDVDVGLDARAAAAIVAGRPHATLETVAAAAYVGGAALEKIRAYAALHPIDDPDAWVGPRIVGFQVSNHYDFDPEWDEMLDGVLIEFTTVRAVDCKVDVASTTGVLLESHDHIGIAGPFFVAGFTTANPTPYAFDVTLECTDSRGAFVREVGHTDNTPTPPPADPACDGSGGTFDGVSFTAAEECAAARFMNRARWSQMGLVSDVGRRVAYDSAPDGEIGQRRSAWTNVAAFAALSGMGRTSVESIKAASSSWVEDDAGRFDTVAHTWANRASLADAPISLDRVYVTRKTVDFLWPSTTRACVELRDGPGAANYLEACLFHINADSAPGCTNAVNECLDPAVGTFVKIRGKLRSTGGRTSIVLHHDGPMAARSSLD